MEPPPLPIPLWDGILLEDSKTVLQWGSTREEAWKTAKPAHHNLPDDDTRIEWDERILGGLTCRLLAYLPDSQRLYSVMVWLLLPEDSYWKNDALYCYCRFFDHLLARIGTPKMRPGSGYAPILTWAHEGCMLQLYTGERHGNFTTLEICHGKRPSLPVE